MLVLIVGRVTAGVLVCWVTAGVLRSRSNALGARRGVLGLVPIGRSQAAVESIRVMARVGFALLHYVP